MYLCRQFLLLLLRGRCLLRRYDVRFLPESRAARAAEAVEAAVRRCQAGSCRTPQGPASTQEEAAAWGLQGQHAVLDEFGERLPWPRRGTVLLGALAFAFLKTQNIANVNTQVQRCSSV